MLIVCLILHLLIKTMCNILKILLLSSFMFIFSISLFAQIQFENKIINYKKIYTKPEPISFKFTNIGREPLAILKTIKSPRIEISYSRGYIQYGQKGHINISYTPTKIGSFNERILVYTNLNLAPDTLFIKGKSLVEQACPTFKKNKNHKIYQRHITVVDINTKDKIEDAKVNFTYNFSTKIPFSLGKKGFANKILKPGQYTANVSAKNYKPHSEKFYLPKSHSLLVFELEPINPKLINNNNNNNDTISTNSLLSFSSIIDSVKKKKKTRNSEKEKEKAERVVEEIDRKEKLEIEKAEKKIKSDTTILIDSIIVKQVDSSVFSENLYASNNITFLIDISSSMNTAKRIDILKECMQHLISMLRDIDIVTIITYSNDVKFLATGVSGENKELLLSIVDSLKAFGPTHGLQGIDSAYSFASANFKPKGNNQIIIATDGAFNGPDYSERQLKRNIKMYAEKGIILSIIGFGKNETLVGLMKNMAYYGKGNYIHVSYKSDFKEVLTREIKQNSIIK